MPRQSRVDAPGALNHIIVFLEDMVYSYGFFSRLQRADRPLIPAGLNRIIEQLRMFLKLQHQVFPP